VQASQKIRDRVDIRQTLYADRAQRRPMIRQELSRRDGFVTQRVQVTIAPAADFSKNVEPATMECQVGIFLS
jgi:hypothetical protein